MANTILARHRDEVDRMAETDGDIILRLRELQRQHQAGEISAGEFDRAYRALNAEVDRQCDRCGGSPAPFLHRRQTLCGRCYQAVTR